MLPLVFLTGLALIALANPDPLAREALCIHLSALAHQTPRSGTSSRVMRKKTRWNALFAESDIAAAVVWCSAMNYAKPQHLLDRR